MSIGYAKGIVGLVVSALLPARRAVPRGNEKRPGLFQDRASDADRPAFGGRLEGQWLRVPDFAENRAARGALRGDEAGRLPLVTEGLAVAAGRRLS